MNMQPKKINMLDLNVIKDEDGNEVDFNEKFEEMDEKKLSLFLKKHHLIKDKLETETALSRVGCEHSLYIFSK